MAHGFREEFEKLGGKIVTEVLYTAGQSTYRRELQQMSRSNPDAYIYTAYGQESAVINREAFELGRARQAALRREKARATEAALGCEKKPARGGLGSGRGGARAQRLGITPSGLTALPSRRSSK